MNKNMGTADRVLRFIGVIVIVALYLAEQISGTLAIVLGVFAVAFFVTSLIGWCPLYLPFGLSTRAKTPSQTPGS